MDDTYENVDHQSAPAVVSESGLYATAIPTGNSMPQMPRATTPITTSRFQMPLPSIPSEIQTTNLGVSQTHTIGEEQNTRYRGINHSSTVQSGQYRCGTAVPSQGKEQNAFAGKKAIFVTSALFGFSIAFSVALLIVILVVRPGETEEIKSTMGIMASQQSDYTDQYNSKINSLQAIIDDLKVNNTAQTSDMKSMRAIIKSQQANYVNQAAEISNMKTLIESLQSNLTATTSELQEEIYDLTLRLSHLDKCKVIYDGKCYWANNTSEVTVTAARKICEAYGANSANIYSAEHFEVIRAYLATMARNGDDYVTGMNYNGESITLRDGGQAPFVRWYRGAPHGSSSTIVMFDSHTLATEAGFWNVHAGSTQEGLLCEKDITS